MPFAEPTGYGMGKHGWVTLILLRDDVIALDALEAWIVESYRAVAPKRLVATLDATSTPPDPAAPDISPPPG